MTKEELKKLKEWIANLSEEDKKERNEYLRALATGELQGPPVGYMSIDRTYLKYYDKNTFNKDMPKGIFYDLLRKRNSKNLSRVAFEFFLSKITYKKMFENVDALIKSLSNAGVKNNDYVGVCMLGTPESMYSLFSMSYIGSVGIFFPPYLDKNSMISDLNCNNTKILILVDYFYYDPKYKKIFDEVIEKTGIEKVVIVPLLNSSILGKLRKKKELDNPKFIYYDDFIKQGEHSPMPEMAKYEPDKALAAMYSSGSTGILKAGLQSNDTFVNSAESYVPFGFDLAPGQKFYHVIPPFTSTGLIANATNPLYYGSTLYQNPTFDPISYSKNIGIHRLNWGIATTELFNGLKVLMHKKSFKYLVKMGILNYKKLNNAYIGGTVSTKIDREELNDTLEEIGAPAKIMSSYGTSENGSIVTAELPHIVCTIEPEKSVGIPLPGVDIMTVDETGDELPTGMRGEIAVSSKCSMLGYFNRPNLSNGFFYDGGNRFNHTHDIGKVSREGFLIYCGRESDVSTVNSNTFYNFDVKDAIFQDPNVRDCEVLTNNDGMYCAHIVFDKSVSDIDNEIAYIQNMIYETFGSTDQVPKYFKVREKFPMAASTKRDFPALRRDSEGFKYYEFTHNKQYIKK